MNNEELEKPAKREKLLYILNLVDMYNPPTPSGGGDDDKSDDGKAFAADVQKGYQEKTSNDEKAVVGDNHTSG